MPYHDQESDRELLIRFRTDRSRWLSLLLSNKGLIDYDDAGWHYTREGLRVMAGDNE